MSVEPTDAEVAVAGDALDRWLTQLGLPGNLVTATRPYGAARAVLAALTAAGWVNLRHVSGYQVDGEIHRPADVKVLMRPEETNV